MGGVSATSDFSLPEANLATATNLSTWCLFQQSRLLRLLPWLLRWLLRWLRWLLRWLGPVPQDRLQRGVAGDAPSFPVQFEGVDASGAGLGGFFKGK